MYYILAAFTALFTQVNFKIYLHCRPLLCCPLKGVNKLPSQFTLQFQIENATCKSHHSLWNLNVREKIYL